MDRVHSNPDEGPEHTNIISHPHRDSFRNRQLSLFQAILCNTEEEHERISHTIELWDALPKYCISRQRMHQRRDRGILPTVQRPFEYRGRAYTMVLRPARLTARNGQDKEFYPSAREELVEDVLRKIAIEQDAGFLCEQRHKGSGFGVTFTLRAVRRELARHGHTLSHREIVEALDVMARCSIEIHAADGTAEYQGSILAGVSRVSRTRYRDDPDARWDAWFSPLAAHSLPALAYRQYDYARMMSLGPQLARWLHKRLAHTYLNASLANPYALRFSTVRRDSGLLEYGRQRDGIAKLDAAFDELCKARILLSVAKAQETGPRGGILDVLYMLIPSPQFVAQVKAANKRHGGARVIELPPPDHPPER